MSYPPPMPPATPPAPSLPPGIYHFTPNALASTGSDISAAIAIGLLLIAVGVVALIVARLTRKAKP